MQTMLVSNVCLSMTMFLFYTFYAEKYLSEKKVLPQLPLLYTNLSTNSHTEVCKFDEIIDDFIRSTWYAMNNALILTCTSVYGHINIYI